MDASHNVHVTGITDSTNFPVTSNATQPVFGGGTPICPSGSTCGDGFVTTLNATGSALTFSTFLGGSSDEGGADIALDTSGYAYVAGVTGSTDFPTTAGAFDKTCGTDGTCTGGLVDATVTKIGASADLSLTKTAPSTVHTGATLTYTIVVTNVGPDGANTVKITDNMPTGTNFNSVTFAAGTCTAPSPGSTGPVVCTANTLAKEASATETLVVNVTAATGSVINNTATVNSKTFDPKSSNNTAQARTRVN